MVNRINQHPIALITGSSSGLGFEIAKILDKKGMRLLLTGRSREKLNQMHRKLSQENEHILFCGDLTEDRYLDQVIHEIIKNNIIPDVIIHNLGGKITDDVHPLTINKLQESMLYNLEIPIKINLNFLPNMVDKKKGRIIHVSSDSSITGQAAPGYVTAKAAVNGYVKSTSRFYAKHSIMICAVLPGIFEHDDSAWTRKRIEQPDYYSKKVSQMPLGRFGRADEIAKFISDLACSESMMSAGSLIELTGAYL